MTVGHNGVFSIGVGVTVFIDGNFAEIGAVNQGDGSLIDPSTVLNTSPHGGGGGSGVTASISITNDSTYSAGGQYNGSYILTTPLLTGTGVLEVDPVSAGSDGDLVLNTGTVTSTQTVVFTGTNGILTLGTNGGSMAVSGFASTISGFEAGDTIAVETTAAAGFAYGGTGTTITVNDLVGGQATGALEGMLTFANAAMAGIAYNTVGALGDQVTCFAAGTLIETDRGPVAVEALREGDRVVTSEDARCEPIVWIGRRAVDCRPHPRPEQVWPVRVRRGAFGPRQPVRDLYLSPDHAVFVNDVLVPVKYLVNGSSIAQVRRKTVMYYHVELPQHELILAEGLAVESYLDVGDRSNFENGGGVVALFPNFTSLKWETEGCAPLVVTGPELEAARAVVSDRLRRPGPRKRKHAA